MANTLTPLPKPKTWELYLDLVLDHIHHSIYLLVLLILPPKCTLNLFILLYFQFHLNPSLHHLPSIIAPHWSHHFYYCPSGIFSVQPVICKNTDQNYCSLCISTNAKSLTEHPSCAWFHPCLPLKHLPFADHVTYIHKMHSISSCRALPTCSFLKLESYSYTLPG